MAGHVDMDQIYDIMDRLNRMEVNQGLEQQRTRPAQTSTRIKEQLMGKFQEYRLPWMTTVSHAEYALLSVKQKIREAKERNVRRRLLGQATVNAEEEFWRQKHEWTRKTDGTTIGYDFAREEFKTDWPLAYDGEVKLSDFTKYIAFFSDSKILLLHDTLINLLEAAQKKGLDWTHLTSLLHQFIQEYQPAQETASFQFLRTNDAQGLYGLLVELINPAAELAKLRAARAKITREPGESITTVLQKLKSLASQELTLNNVHLAGEMLDARAAQLTTEHVKEFVSAETWSV